MAEELGFSGRVARQFLRSELTPLLALTALLMGVFAVLVTPREEEPQIDVTFANIIIGFPGASAAQVENLVASPMEKILSEIAGVKHIYSVSRPGVAVLTVQFKVGEERNGAIVRLYNAIYSNQDWQSPGSGVLPPLIKPRGIDDVPILSLTLWTNDPARAGYELGQVARAIETEIKRVPGTRDVYTIGSPDSVVRVALDPQKLSGFGLSADDLIAALAAAGQAEQAGMLVGSDRSTPVQAGAFLAGSADVANLIVAVRGGRPIYLGDVADVSRGPDTPDAFVWHGTGAAGAVNPARAVHAPAVTIAVAKKPGENAIDVATAVLERVASLRGTYIPEGIEITETRNYGVTANDKAQKLIQKLMFATLSVVVLVLVAIGRREAIVVGAAVVVTLAATLFASWAWGFTINRVSLFALIFSIGILVDDAIVIVENIHRRRQLDRGSFLDLIPGAVDEVGGPTILATFTVIAALLPMAFVSGLMGPYMSPIPINASMGMVISLAVALIFTPWLSGKLLASVAPQSSEAGVPSALHRGFERVMRPFVQGTKARPMRHRLYAGLVVAILLAVSLTLVQWVVLKMLPFDNKSEFQVILDMPEGTPVERTARVLEELSRVIGAVPEVRDYQVYAGTASPINFNGLVRQYYLRSGPEQGDIQVNLLDQHERDRASHEIALNVRPRLAAIARKYGASLQVVEVPPGPPVQAPIVAEVYGPSYPAQRDLARQLRSLFDKTPDIMDVDDSNEAAASRYAVTVDRQKAALLGISQAQVVRAMTIGLRGQDAGFVHEGPERRQIPIRLGLPVADKAELNQVLELEVRSAAGDLVPLSEVTRVEQVAWDGAIYHKDLLPVVFVTGDMAGRLDSPLYGMFDLVSQIRDDQLFISAPDDPNRFAIKWDGEWQITYETFRDMGLAYSVGLVLIYLLIVAQFRSYVMPLIIMAPIPLTIIGVLPGHALLGAQFTATSMIGMIALAGIIVRNSILLVDFIDAEIARGELLEHAVVGAAAVRARPIILTALAAISGALFILDDPIFNGLAVSLIFGILVSTLLTLAVIPIFYFAYRSRQLPLMGQEGR